MNKELEALNGLAQFIIMNDTGTDESASAIEWHNTLKQALTPPTSEEVCEVLSEYFIDKYICVDNKFYNYGGNEPKAVIYKIECGVVIKYALPPHLITLIGRFYEGMEKKDV